MIKLPVSVIILARNEEKHIARAIASAAFAEEILVIDAKSEDRTREIARELGATVIERAWTGFREQRNFALDQARFPWTLSLDADEAATPELAVWIAAFFRDRLDTQAPYGYKIHRIEYFLGREITGACWNPSYQDRFVRRDKARFVGEIHEYPEVEGGLVRAPAEAAILHNPRVTVESFLEKMNRYTTVEAWDRYRQGQRTKPWHMGVTFFSTWFKNYFLYRAYRDGTHGFVISLLEAVSRTVRHVKLWQIQRLTAEAREDLLLTPERALETGARVHRGLESEDTRG